MNSANSKIATGATSNEAAWNELSRRKVLCSQPNLHLIPLTAEALVNRHGFYDTIDLANKKVLCLAAGGGQQSIAFALLGAEVTVVDFSTVQLSRDKEAAASYNRPIRIVKADMRDLSFSPDGYFDIVCHPYSINYIPEVHTVFGEVSRVLKPGGYYDLMFHNPYVHGTWKDGCWGNKWAAEDLWKGKGYPIWQPYKDGYAIQTDDPYWNFVNSDNEHVRLRSPQEYRHTMGTVLNGLIKQHLEMLQFREEVGDGFNNEPGSWEHYISCAPPWFYLFARKKNE